MEESLQDPGTEFIEGLGLAAESDGLPRIAGRILGLLIFEQTAYRFDQLSKRLQISRASVSTNTRLLESMGMVERFTQPGERRDFFRLGEDIFGRLLANNLERLERMHRLTDRCLQALPTKQARDHEGLRSMLRFYELALKNNERVLDEWHGNGTKQRRRVS